MLKKIDDCGYAESEILMKAATPNFFNFMLKKFDYYGYAEPYLTVVATPNEIFL